VVSLSWTSFVPFPLLLLFLAEVDFSLTVDLTKWDQNVLDPAISVLDGSSGFYLSLFPLPLPLTSILSSPYSLPRVPPPSLTRNYRWSLSSLATRPRSNRSSSDQVVRPNSTPLSPFRFPTRLSSLLTCLLFASSLQDSGRRILSV